MNRSKFSIALGLILITFFVAGCKYSNYLPPFLRSSFKSEAEPEDMFELEEIPLEVTIPKEIKEADYFFTLEIKRDGTVLNEPISYSQSDEVEVVVYGKDERLLGENKHGDQIVFVLQEGGCTMHCGGDIGYIVIGDLDTHCIMELRFTQIPQMTSCTSECAPGVPLSWSTGVGEVIIEPLLVNFKDLANGVSRIEKLGNMKWEAKYKLKDFNGLPFIKYCDKNDLP
jgi:hypothetical protein